MPQATLTFSAPLNESCQVGDTAFYVDTSSSGGFTVNSNNVTEIGSIRQINNATSSSPSIICQTTAPGNLNGTSKYIFFAKNNQANLNFILGYYAEVKFVCDDTAEAEIHQAGIDMFESSGNE